MREEAMKLALEALNTPRPTDSYPPLWRSYEKTINDAITALKQALAAPVQEPVAWMHVMDNTEGIKANGKGIVSITQKRKHPFGKPGVDFSKSFPVTSTPLYTTPPASQRTWVGLTDEEILEAAGIDGADTWLFETAYAIEAKLKEKNT